MQLLMILPRWVGDLVMSTPMIRAVAEHYRRERAAGEMRITAALQPHLRGLLEGTDWIDELVPYDRRGRDREVRFAAVARRLRALRPDVALIVPNSLSTAALAWAAGARRRVGVSRHGRRLLLTDPLPPPRRGLRIEPRSTAEHAMDLAERIGVPRQRLNLQLATTDEDEARGDAVLGRLFPGWRIDRDGPLVVINDNGAFGPAKSWGVSRSAALACWLVERLPGARVLVHCGPGDRDEARRVVGEAGREGVRGLADEPELPFGLSKALLRRAAAVVTSDSGPRHIAAAFGTPTVVLHGPMDPRLSRSDHPSLVEMRVDLACSPCGRRICPLGHHDCMRLLTVDDVGQAVRSLLERPSAPAVA